MTHFGHSESIYHSPAYRLVLIFGEIASIRSSQHQRCSPASLLAAHSARLCFSICGTVVTPALQCCREKNGEQRTVKVNGKSRRSRRIRFLCIASFRFHNHTCIPSYSMSSKANCKPINTFMYVQLIAAASFSHSKAS